MLLCGDRLTAQTAHRDSVYEIAKADVQNFRLNKADFKEFRESGRNKAQSDYFKPIATNVSNSQLLQDSAYVKTYRHLAFMKTKRRRTTAYYILATIAGIAALVIIVSFIADYGGGGF